MNRTLLTVSAILALLVSLIGTTFTYPVRADSTDSIHFIDSGVTIFSPVNTTYYYTNLVLNVSLASAGVLGGLDPNISMNYSVDGIHSGSVPLESNREIHITTTAVAKVVLPELPNGSHCLTIYLYGLNQRTYEPKYLSFINTVYFSTVGNPILSPTTSPTSIPTPSPPPTPSPSPSPTPSPKPTQEPRFSMPKEYLNYTITTQNGTALAIVDGTYPIYCPNAGNAGNISMVYPTPPDTTNIIIKLNGTQLSWTNFTEQFPDALHHTAIGDWAMIETGFSPSEFFVLSIHYEHPVARVNGGYQFLYDLNIIPYLSASSPNSTAYFSLKTENALPDLKIFTVPSDDTRNELEYAVQRQGEVQEVTFAVTSEYDKPLPGDVLVTFSGSEPQTQEPLPTILIAGVSIVVVVVVLGVVVWRRKNVRGDKYE